MNVNTKYKKFIYIKEKIPATETAREFYAL